MRQRVSKSCDRACWCFLRKFDYLHVRTHTSTEVHCMLHLCVYITINVPVGAACLGNGRSTSAINLGGTTHLTV